MMLVTAFLSEVNIYNKSIDNVDIMEYNRRIILKGVAMVTRNQMCMCQMCMRRPASMPSLRT